MRQHLSDLYLDRLPFIDEILSSNLDAPMLTYPRVFNVRDSKRAFEYIVEKTGLGLFLEKSEGEMISYDKILQGFNQKFTHVEFAKGVAISSSAAEDDIDGAIDDTMPDLSFAVRASIETFIWNVFNNGFSSTLSSDGSTLFNASHTLRGGGTFGNLLTNSDLAVSTLQTALNIFDNMIDERGLPVEMEAANLVYPPGLRWLVHEILRSDLRPDTANNASNAFKEVSLNPVMVKYLTGADDWFVTADPSRVGTIVYWRKEPYSDHTIDFDTGNLKSKMGYRLSAGASTWRGVVGAQGA